MGPDIKLSDITETNDHPCIMFLISVNYKILLFSAVSDKFMVTEKNSLVCCFILFATSEFADQLS